MKLACLLLICSVWSGTVLLLSIAQKFDSNWIIQKKQRSASSGYEGDETWHKDSGSFDRSNDETKAKKQVVLPEVGIPFYVTPFPHKMLSPRVNDGDQHATLPPEIKQVLTLVSEDKPVTPPTVSDVVVLCGESDMVVKVKKRFFGFGCTASQLTLGYSYECQSNGVDRETGDLVFTYSYSACGSKRSMPDGLVIYQNVLRYVPNRRRSSIRRAHPVNIEIECRYPRYHHLYKLVFRPTWYPPAGIRTLKQFGFDLIPMNSKYRVWTKGSLSNVYQLGQTIPFQVRGYLRNPGQKLFIHSCHATASPDPKSTPQYNVIDNYGCMVDSKTEACNSSFVPPRTRDTINFVVDAFQFNVKPSSKIYLHCVLFIANSPLVTPGAKSCTYNRIEERWEELEGFNSVCTCCNSKCAGEALESLSEDLKSSGPLLFVDNKVKEQSSVGQNSDLLDDNEETSSSSSDQDDQFAWLNAVETAENMTEQGKSSHIDAERQEVEMYSQDHYVPANKHGAPEEPSEGVADPYDEWDEYEEVPQEEKYEDVPQSEEHNGTGQWENLKWHFDEGTRRPGWVKGSDADQSEGAAQSEEAEQHKWLEGEGADRTWDDAEGTDSDYVDSEDYHDAMDEGALQSDGMDPIEWSEQTDQLDWDGDEEEKYEDVPQSEEHNGTGQWESLKWHFDEGTRRPGWVKGSDVDQSEGAAQSEEAEQHKWLEGEGADDQTWDDAEGTDSDYVDSEDYHDAMDEGDLQSDGMDPIEWSEHPDQLDWDGDEGYSSSDWDEGEGIVQSEGGLENGKADENQSNETILSEEFQGNRTSLSEAHKEGANYSEWGASVGTVQDAERAGGFGVPPGHPTEQQDAPDELNARMRRNPAQSTWGKMLTDHQE
ncbi:UNVERIFIED_CONTAM: hypothetical protein FKN15_078389 [Acipenser sinensis]